MKPLGSVLVCDDDENIANFLEQILSKKGNHIVSKTHSGEECLEKWNKSIDVVILDFQLVNLNGLDVLKAIKIKDPLAVVIMATAHSSEKVVIESLRLGAYNYIKKPYDINYLLSTVKEGIFEANQRRVAQGLTLSKSSAFSSSKSIHKSLSKSVQDLEAVIEKVSKKNISMLLSGDSGTGKEYFANLIYTLSNRSSEKFIPINCPAIPANLAESELFGHEKGSFTGADQLKLGKLEVGNNGIIFLDEIADLSLEIQAKLLRVLQEREIYRVGGTKPIPINIVIISATSKDLRAEIEAGRFRSDLYYRIADINLNIPRLKDRIEDVENLSKFFIKEYSVENNEDIKSLNNDAIELLKSYQWPGNIRELKSFIRKLMILVPENTINATIIASFFETQMIGTSDKLQSPEHNHQDILNDNPANANAIATGLSSNQDNKSSGSIKEMEKDLILQSIHANRSNLTVVAKELGMSRSTLYRKLKKYGIEAK